LTAHVAWRVSFVTVPFIIVMVLAMAILFLCPDTPTGAWKDRHLNTAVVQEVEGDLKTPPSTAGAVVDVSKFGMEDASQSGRLSSTHDSAELEKGEMKGDMNKDVVPRRGSFVTRRGSIIDKTDVKFAEVGVIKKPTIKDVAKVAFHLPVLTQCVCYFITFGGELAINSNLSSFYIKSSGTPPWTQTLAANWAAMYGLLNIVTRPLGGYIADWLYPHAGIEGKKFWMIFCMLLLRSSANFQALLFRGLYSYALDSFRLFLCIP
jgi:MFS transporter, NNP family, nitrate/nitrite transporter